MMERGINFNLIPMQSSQLDVNNDDMEEETIIWRKRDAKASQKQEQEHEEDKNPTSYEPEFQLQQMGDFQILPELKINNWWSWRTIQNNLSILDCLKELLKCDLFKNCHACDKWLHLRGFMENEKF